MESERSAPSTSSPKDPLKQQISPKALDWKSDEPERRRERPGYGRLEFELFKRCFSLERFS